MGNDPFTAYDVYPPARQAGKSFSLPMEWLDLDRRALEALIERSRAEASSQGPVAPAGEFGAIRDGYVYGVISKEEAERMALYLSARPVCIPLSQDAELRQGQIDAGQLIAGTLNWSGVVGPYPSDSALAARINAVDYISRTVTLTPPPEELRVNPCFHELGADHSCQKCGASAELLESLINTCVHERALDYMATGERFCTRCGLTDTHMEILTRPVVAGDEAASRGELTFLPDIHNPGEEDKSE